MLKQRFIGADGRKEDQPPSGGCVLKRVVCFDGCILSIQPPSGGCVLKHG